MWDKKDTYAVSQARGKLRCRRAVVLEGEANFGEDVAEKVGILAAEV